MIYLIYFEQILIKIIKSLEDSGVLIDGVTETLKRSGFLGALLAPLAASLVQPVISSVVKDIKTELGKKLEK